VAPQQSGLDSSGLNRPDRTTGILINRASYTRPRRRKPNPTPVSNRTRRMMIMTVSMSPPTCSCGLAGVRGGSFAAAAGEGVDDLVGLVFDGRFRLVALALVF
jgi:hypothetical protein